MLVPLTDGSLDAARSGAGWAFERIYTALAGPVRRYLDAQGVADPDACTQDVFLRAFQAIGTFEGDAERLRSWIFTIAHNRLIDERRTRSRRPVCESVDELVARPDEACDDGTEAVVLRERVLLLLSALPGAQRHVVVLRFLCDLSLAEVAEVTGCSLVAVKALQHRGLERLRLLVEETSDDRASNPALAAFTTS